MAHANNFLAKGYGSTQQFIPPFQLLDDSGNVLFAVASDGTVTASGMYNGTSDFSVNTNKFTVASASGNTVVAGTLNVTGAAVLASTLSAVGLTNSASLLWSEIDAAISAKTGGGQDSAASSSKTIAIVTTVTSGNDSFTLPAATGSGRIRIVANQAAANSLQLFGLGSDTVNAASSGTGVAVTTKKNAFCVDYAAGKWLAIIA